MINFRVGKTFPTVPCSLFPAFDFHLLYLSSCLQFSKLCSFDRVRSLLIIQVKGHPLPMGNLIINN